MTYLERRPAGVVERWYLARTRAEATPVVHVGFSLSLPSPLTSGDIQAHLGLALQQLPRVHPFLSTRVLGYEGTENPEMVLIKDEFTPEEVLEVSEDPSFEYALDQQLTHKFDMSSRLWGAWLYLSPSSLSPQGTYTQAYCAVFIHHAIADGVAVGQVARSLVLLLNNLDFTLPTPQGGLPIPLEERVSIAPSYWATATAVFQAFIHPRLPLFVQSLYAPRTLAWEGSSSLSPPPPPPPPRKSVHHILTISPSQMSQLLALGKQQGLTFTTLLHTLLFLAISPLADQQKQHLYSSVPASLIPWVHPSHTLSTAPVGGCYVGPYYFRAPPLPQPSTLQQFWEQCKPYAKFLKDDKSVRNGMEQWGLVGMLDYPGLVRFWEKKHLVADGRNSFSISNLRHVGFKRAQVQGGWTPRRAVFTQPMMGSSATFLADVVSTGVEGEGEEGEGEGCTVVFVWEEGILEDEVARGIVERTREGWEWVLREAEKAGGAGGA